MVVIGLLDIGAGNITSVRNSLEYLGLEVLELNAPKDFLRATHFILPGVGTFGNAMTRLQNRGWIGPLKEAVLQRRSPFLGICVGMQILATEGREFETHAGLGWIPGRVEKLPVGAHGLRLPHMGWNHLQVRKGAGILQQLPPSPAFYFVHSYGFVPEDEGVISATARYGAGVTAVVHSENMWGVQFHPEKSQQEGLQVLRNFGSL
jgi:glutamine amidotransferase